MRLPATGHPNPSGSTTSTSWLPTSCGAALHLTRASAIKTLSDALELVDRLPKVWEALHEGQIDSRRARTITIGTEHLGSGLSREIADVALERAPNQTTGQLAARLRRLCVDHNPADAKDRYLTALEQRRLTAVQTPDHTANLYGTDLPPDRVSAARHRINRIARQLRRRGEARTLDQLRADVFLDLLTGDAQETKNTHSTANITVDLTTLAGLDDRSGEIPGMGPVIADIARQTASQASKWEYQVHDPVTGDVIASGTTRRRPTSQLARSIRAIHPTCVFPGCRMPSAECDLDHTLDHAQGGPTTESNLEPLCRHDHRLKHGGRWELRRFSDGRYQWVSRHGHTHDTKPEQPP